VLPAVRGCKGKVKSLFFHLSGKTVTRRMKMHNKAGERRVELGLGHAKHHVSSTNTIIQW